jgi:hypothetical protein
MDSSSADIVSPQETNPKLHDVKIKNLTNTDFIALEELVYESEHRAQRRKQSTLLPSHTCATPVTIAPRSLRA